MASNHGLRGSTLEALVNMTIDRYREDGLALIQKIPTPITPVEIDQESRHITLAYFDQKSTVDYIGAVQGIPVCFDAKESKIDTVPLANVHEHQMASEAGGRKSFTYDELDQAWRIFPGAGEPVPFLDLLQKDLDERGE